MNHPKNRAERLRVKRKKDHDRQEVEVSKKQLREQIEQEEALEALRTAGIVIEQKDPS